MARYWLRALVVHFVLGTIAECLGPGSPQSAAQSTGSAGGPAGSGAVRCIFQQVPYDPRPGAPEHGRRAGADIGLTPEQKQQLKAVSDGYVASMQQLGKSFREFSPEEQQKRAKTSASQVAQFARNAQRKAEAILTPQQLQAVEKIAFQLSAAARRCRIRPCKRSSASARSNVSG